MSVWSEKDGRCGDLRPPGRWVVREDTVSESQFLESPGAAAETMLDISSDQQ